MKQFGANCLLPLFFVFVTAIIGLALVSPFAVAAQKGGKPPVQTLEICPTAEITTIEYFMKKSKFSGGPKFHVKIGIKNISDKPLRYRVSIFLPNGASSGGFYPRKGKPPVLKPGEEKVRTFPMYCDSIPDAFTVKVEEL